MTSDKVTHNHKWLSRLNIFFQILLWLELKPFKWQCAQMRLLYYFTIMPDNFTRQGENAATQWVKILVPMQPYTFTIFGKLIHC